MPRIETGPTRPIGAVDVRIARQAGGQDKKTENAATPTPPAVVRSDALDPGEPPVDAERVAMIRKAVESGTYPVVPTRIADAMIAAGMMLRSAK
jgi:negative regulator of flagellin synthesis FlgM